ncbi:hypothetical protein BN1723_010843 [Verticillium longisporum]|uniref:Uncharacterized protein n=1 Tax=Verticillium longisporum TaxID=100787 RepID=A0A0G4L1N3_VERLO|nr:hypothetical protein BN1723_010843 [Verticillium longisporum]
MPWSSLEPQYNPPFCHDVVSMGVRRRVNAPRVNGARAAFGRPVADLEHVAAGARTDVVLDLPRRRLGTANVHEHDGLQQADALPPVCLGQRLADDAVRCAAKVTARRPVHGRRVRVDRHGDVASLDGGAATGSPRHGGHDTVDHLLPGLAGIEFELAAVGGERNDDVDVVPVPNEVRLEGGLAVMVLEGLEHGGTGDLAGLAGDGLVKDEGVRVRGRGQTLFVVDFDGAKVDLALHILLQVMQGYFEMQFAHALQNELLGFLVAVPPEAWILA